VPEAGDDDGEPQEEEPQSPAPAPSGLKDAVSKQLIALVPSVLSAAGAVGTLAIGGSLLAWLRFDSAGLPASKAVGLIPRDELVATGTAGVAAFVFAALFVVAVYIAVQGVPEPAHPAAGDAPAPQRRLLRLVAEPPAAPAVDATRRLAKTLIGALLLGSGTIALLIDRDHEARYLVPSVLALGLAVAIVLVLPQLADRVPKLLERRLAGATIGLVVFAGGPALITGRLWILAPLATAWILVAAMTAVHDAVIQRPAGLVTASGMLLVGVLVFGVAAEVAHQRNEPELQTSAIAVKDAKGDVRIVAGYAIGENDGDTYVGGRTGTSRSCAGFILSVPTKQVVATATGDYTKPEDAAKAIRAVADGLIAAGGLPRGTKVRPLVSPVCADP
jgi:hypothetical protein